jgi:hypothetical protein
MVIGGQMKQWVAAVGVGCIAAGCAAAAAAACGCPPCGQPTLGGRIPQNTGCVRVGNGQPARGRVQMVAGVKGSGQAAGIVCGGQPKVQSICAVMCGGQMKQRVAGVGCMAAGC